MLSDLILVDCNTHSLKIEHQRYWTLQSDHQGWWDSAGVLQQWNRNVCTTLLAFANIRKASYHAQVGSCNRLVQCQRLIGFHYFSIIVQRNFESIILKGYRWLSDHYKPGDQIFLFGVLRNSVDFSEYFTKHSHGRFFSWRIPGPRSGRNDSNGSVIYSYRQHSLNVDKIGRPHIAWKWRTNPIVIRIRSFICLNWNLASAYELYADLKHHKPSSGYILRTSFSAYGLTLIWRWSEVRKYGDKAVGMAERFKETFSRKDVMLHFLGVWYVLVRRAPIFPSYDPVGTLFRLLASPAGKIFRSRSKMDTFATYVMP